MADKNIFDSLNPIPEESRRKLFDPSADVIGKTAGGLFSFVSIPFRSLGFWSEDVIARFENKIIERNQEIPEEYRDFSKFQQTVKAIDDAKYSLGQEELQDLFINLISGTLDSRKNIDIHPSFSSILKEFSTLDADLFDRIYREKRVPTASIVYHSSDWESEYSVERNILLFDEGILRANNELNSLERLGLIEIHTTRNLQASQYSKRYTEFETNPFYKDYEDAIEQNPIEGDGATIDSISVNKGHLRLSHIGKSFGSIIIQ